MPANNGLILMSFCLFRFPMLSMFKAEKESIQTWQISLDLMQISPKKSEEGLKDISHFSTSTNCLFNHVAKVCDIILWYKPLTQIMSTEAHVSGQAASGTASLQPFQAERTMSIVAKERQMKSTGRRAFLPGDAGLIFLIRISRTRWVEEFNLNG